MPTDTDHDDDLDDDTGDDDTGDTGDDDRGGDTDDTGDDAGDDDKPLGPQGEKALKAEKERRRKATAELREWKALGLSAAEVKAILDKRKEDGDGPTPDEVREEAKREAKREVLHDRITDKIEAKAGNRFRLDAADVVALVLRRHNLDDFVDGDTIDVDAIEDALGDLLTSSPDLATAQRRKRFEGDGDGGSRNDARPKQLTRADLAGMTPQDIEKARREGRLDDLLAGKSK